MNNFSNKLNIEGSHEESSAVDQPEELETQENASRLSRPKECGSCEKKTHEVSLQALSPSSNTPAVKRSPHCFARARVSEKRALLPRAIRRREVAISHPVDPLPEEAQHLAGCAEFPGWIKVWHKLLETGKTLSDDHTAKTFLGQFHIILKKDLAAGKVVLKQASLMSRYDAFFSLLQSISNDKEGNHLSRQVCKMFNTQWIDHELETIAKRPYQIASSHETFLEQLLLRSLFQGHITEEEHRAHSVREETAALHRIYHSEEATQLPINDFVNVAQGVCALARMSAFGVTHAQAKALVTIRDVLAHAGKQIDEIGSAQKTHIGTMKIELKGLQIASQKLLDIRQALVESTHQKLLADFVCKEKKFLLGLLNRSPKSVTRELDKRLQPLIESARRRTIYEKIDETILQQLEVYERLAPDISQEMSQGANDPQEVFLGGVCAALTLRWATFEQFHPDLSPALSPTLRFGTVLPEDRFNQAFYQIHKRLGSNNTIRDGQSFEQVYVQAQYPSHLLRRLDMKEGIFRTHISTRGIAPQVLKKRLIDELEKPLYQEGTTSGVICLGLCFEHGAHRLYVRYAPKEAHPEQSVFRIVDSNIGIIEIKVAAKEGPKESLTNAKARFYDRLFTILFEFYHTPTDIVFAQMHPQGATSGHLV